jgi:hypothetical protein
MKKVILATLIFSFLLGSCSKKLVLDINKQEIILSAIKGDKSKLEKLIITNNHESKVELNIEFKGENSEFFKIIDAVPKNINAKESVEIPIQFQPNEDFIGVVKAQLVINSEKKKQISVTLGGLSARGLEGKNEPALSLILQTLVFKIDVGWSSLANTVKPDLQGEEISQTLFKKVTKKDVEVIPVARYSPAFLLPFGYYTIENDSINLHDVGILADSKKDSEHQTLFPEINDGKATFNPKNASFGIYTTSPSHNSYSEDKWNKKYHKKNAAHATRIYKMKDAEGKVIPNQFLICFEEAFNGDYQDYVFILKNVETIK